MLFAILSAVLLPVVVPSGSMQYFSFISTNLDEQPGATVNSTLLDIVSIADDNPFQQVQLPWAFPFFGLELQSVWVSPNGALLYSKVPPAINSYVGDGLDYFGSMAPYLTDLFPGQNLGSKITTYSASDHMTIAFKDVQVFNVSAHEHMPWGINLNNTFRAVLYSDGHVTFHYDSILAPTVLLRYNYSFVSGLIDTFNSDLGFPLCDYTTAQLALAKSDWSVAKTGISGVSFLPGIYPPFADVVTGKQFTACPVSSTWAMAPASLDSNPASLASAIITLTPLQLSCTQDVQYSIFLDGYPSTPATCTPASVAGITTLQCNAQPFRSLSLPTGSYSIKVQWTAIAPGASASGVLDLSVLSLSLTSGGPTTGCFLNSNSTGCDPCAISGGNFTCLNLPCGEVYRPASCDGGCAGTSLFDTTGACCPISTQDCTGTCGGNAIIAFSSYISNSLRMNSSYCCNNIDCFGVCNGDGRLDACQVCGGLATSYLDCPLQVAVNNGDPLNRTDIYPSASLAKPNLIIPITIQNPLSTSYLHAKLTGSNLDNSFAPVVVLQQSQLFIGPSSTAIMNVNISFTKLISGTQANWEVKVLQLDLGTTNGTILGSSRTIHIYPAFSNCSLVASRDTCMRLPTCIFCLRYPTIRLLSEVEESRRLYVDIVPPSSGYGIQILDDTAYGQCSNGQNTEDCTAAILQLYSAASPKFQFYAILLGVLLVCTSYSIVAFNSPP